MKLLIGVVLVILMVGCGSPAEVEGPPIEDPPPEPLFFEYWPEPTSNCASTIFLTYTEFPEFEPDSVPPAPLSIFFMDTGLVDDTTYTHIRTFENNYEVFPGYPDEQFLFVKEYPCGGSTYYSVYWRNLDGDVDVITFPYDDQGGIHDPENYRYVTYRDSFGNEWSIHIHVCTGYPGLEVRVYSAEFIEGY